jgi:hypothetical protein
MAGWFIVLSGFLLKDGSARGVSYHVNHPNLDLGLGPNLHNSEQVRFVSHQIRNQRPRFDEPRSNLDHPIHTNGFDLILPKRYISFSPGRCPLIERSWVCLLSPASPGNGADALRWHFSPEQLHAELRPPTTQRNDAIREGKWVEHRRCGLTADCHYEFSSRWGADPRWETVSDEELLADLIATPHDEGTITIQAYPRVTPVYSPRPIVNESWWPQCTTTPSSLYLPWQWRHEIQITGDAEPRHI